MCWLNCIISPDREPYEFLTFARGPSSRPYTHSRECPSVRITCDTGVGYRRSHQYRPLPGSEDIETAEWSPREHTLDIPPRVRISPYLRIASHRLQSSASPCRSIVPQEHLRMLYHVFITPSDPRFCGVSRLIARLRWIPAHAGRLR